MAARDLRAEGWDEGVDRSRSLEALCDTSRWAERLVAAQAWDADGRPTSARRPAPEVVDWDAMAQDHEIRVQRLVEMGLPKTKASGLVACGDDLAMLQRRASCVS
jgi:hypothetical protein